LSKTIAARKPSLVIHVGDYIYRESPCPAGDKGCKGSPYGDNWRGLAGRFLYARSAAARRRALDHGARQP
jgi:hypothetical protein